MLTYLIIAVGAYLAIGLPFALHHALLGYPDGHGLVDNVLDKVMIFLVITPFWPWVAYDALRKG